MSKIVILDLFYYPYFIFIYSAHNLKKTVNLVANLKLLIYLSYKLKTNICAKRKNEYEKYIKKDIYFTFFK